jgi:hypothetical protein
MSTRSKIGILNQDGTVSAIYCHFDGYLEHNGKILNESYTEEGKVRELIGLGDLSCLGKEIGEPQDFNSPRDRDWCLAYGRDRGEDNTEADIYKDKKEFIDSLDGSWAEYAYLFTENGWEVLDNHSRPKVFRNLKEELKLIVN